MPRHKNPLREEARRLWTESHGTKRLKDIADELGVSASTVRKWKSEDEWDDKSKRSAPIETERYETLHDNHNAAGNSGGAPIGNKNAVSHGLFAKWLPDDTRSLITELYDSNPADIIWNNIMLQYAAIIRSQKIMHVQDEFDHTESLTMTAIDPNFRDPQGNSPTVKAEKDYQYAWDKQANFLAAQSRALGTLSSLIKQFEAMTDAHDERRLKLEGMKATVDKSKAESSIAGVKNELLNKQSQLADMQLLKAKADLGITDDDEEDDGFIEAIDNKMKEVWSDEES